MAKNKNKWIQNYAHKSNMLKGEFFYGPGKKQIMLDSVYSRIINVDRVEFVELYVETAKKAGYAPSFGSALKHLILHFYFQDELKRIMMMPGQMEGLMLLVDHVTDRIGQRLNTELTDGAKPARALSALFSTAKTWLLKDYILVEKDGLLFHITDPVLFPEKDFRRQEIEIWQEDYPKRRTDEKYGELLFVGLCQVMDHKAELSQENFDRLVDWYLVDRGLKDNTAGSEMFAKWLFNLSQIEENGDRLLELYESHTKPLEEIFAKHPRFNFIVKGNATEYVSIADFVRKMPEINELFVEEPNLEGAPGRGKKGRRKGKNDEKKRQHLDMALNAMTELFQIVQAKFTDIHVLNLRSNEIMVENQEVQPYGKYIAIAFRYGNEYYILVDSIFIGSAVYLWHGKSYNKGLEIFKMARTYAMEEPGVIRGYHTTVKGEAKEFMKIYRSKFKEVGVVI